MIFMFEKITVSADFCSKYLKKNITTHGIAVYS